MVDISNQQWVGMLMFAFGVIMLIPLGVAAVASIPTVALPVIYFIVIIFLYMRGNSVRESVLFVSLPTFFTAGVSLVVLSRAPEYPVALSYVGFALAAVSGLIVGWFFYGRGD